jgi:hypothetical protein
VSRSRYYPGPRFITKGYRQLGQRRFRSHDRKWIHHVLREDVVNPKEPDLRVFVNEARWAFW